MNVFIIDDEPLARDELKFLLSKFSEINIIGEAENYGSIDQEQFTDVQCVFLDIELGGENGLEIAQQLSQFENPPLIVLSTAYDDYAIRAFEISVFDYILKPFEEKRIARTIEKLLQHERQNSQTAKYSLTEKLKKLPVFNEDRPSLINIEDILYITSEESKTIVVTEKKRYTCGDTIASLEQKLVTQNFMRVHRAFLINLHHLEALDTWSNSKYNVILQSEHVIPVSRMYVKEIKSLFTN